MVEDKWNSRAEGRKEQKTHQPTGGRGAQGGLRIGEMERDALAGHGVSDFLKESLMERADKTQFRICNGCGTVPIYNARQKLFVCTVCDGPAKFIGSSAQTLEILPTMERSLATTSIIEMPYATKLLGEELQTYLNMGMRFLTADNLTRLEAPLSFPSDIQDAMARPLVQVPNRDVRVPMYKPLKLQEDILKQTEEELDRLGGVVQAKGDFDIREQQEPQPEPELEPEPAGKPEPQGERGKEPQFGGYTQVLQPYISEAPYSGGAPTIVVDTSMEQMEPMEPMSMEPMEPMQPMSMQPMSMQPMSMQPMSPMSMQPMSPMSMQPMSMQPMSMQPMSMQPMSMQPMSMQHMPMQPMNNYDETQRRNTTQKKPKQMTAGGEHVNPTARITIRKLG